MYHQTGPKQMLSGNFMILKTRKPAKNGQNGLDVKLTRLHNSKMARKHQNWLKIFKKSLAERHLKK